MVCIVTGSACHLLARRRLSRATLLQVSWLQANADDAFLSENKLKGDQIKFDWKEVPFREDQLGGYDPDLTPRAVDPKLAPVLKKLSEVFGNAIEVLEANQGVFRFKYHGPVKNQIGMEAWALDLLKEHHPDPDTITECSFLTKHKRDFLFGDAI